MYNILSPLWHSFGCSLNLLRNKKDKLFVLYALSFLQNSHIHTYMDIYVLLYVRVFVFLMYQRNNIPKFIVVSQYQRMCHWAFVPTWIVVSFVVLLYYSLYLTLISIRLVLSNLILIMTLIYMLYDILYRWKTLSCGNHDFLPLPFGSKWTSILFYVYLYSLHVYCVQMNLHIVYECW